VKCSKCGYLGFESAERCRNCGYEFSLAPSGALPDLLLRRDPGVDVDVDLDVIQGLDDIALIDQGAARRAAVGAVGAAATATARAPSLSIWSAASAASELPLFRPAIEDDTPLITKPSPPRPPLSVRRAAPEVPRPRAMGPRPAGLDLGLELDSPVADAPRLAPSERARSAEWPGSDDRRVDAGAARRVLAAVIDAVILSTVDVAVIYLTMQICGVSLADFGLLPKGPLVAFLAIQNVGYLMAFTAGGQTPGKMAVGIQVVTSDPYDVLDAARALKRTVAWLVLACPAGLGLLSALLSHDHRGFHDRFAGTRVVRV
jgi:uncharacterized RDD family membrane protein YckC